MSAGVPMLDLPGSRSSSHVSEHSASIPKLPGHMMGSNGGEEDDESLTFDSPQEEASHYREKYRRILDTLDETRAELDEFQQSSRELEEELEKDLQATEKEKLELKEKIGRLEIEKDEWKAKHVALQKLHSSTTSAMQREMDNLRSERDKTLVALRDLEMGNDELERNERVAVSSLLDLESKYNRAIEEKTLLEQEVVQRQELEEECQRLKDDIRDANSEIAILRDQLTRMVPTPPSSVSVNMSPVQEASRELSNGDIPPAHLGEPRLPRQATTPEPPLRPSPALVRSNTSSSIPTLSPSVKRFSTRLADSPAGMSNLARSTTSRNLAQSAASPSLARQRSSMGPASARQPNGQVVNPNQAAKTKGFRLLYDLQARLKATDDKLGARAPKRLVSGTMPLGISRRTISTAKPKAEERVPTPRPAAPARKHSTPIDPDKSGATFLSPNGWVMVGYETPETHNIGLPQEHPSSPLETNFRSASAASGMSAKTGKSATSGTSGSNKPLPTRPGIPSPLVAELRRSTTASGLSERAAATRNALNAASQAPQETTRPPSRGPSRAATAAATARSASRADSRPMSPSMLPQPSTRSFMRSPTPTFGQALSASTSVTSPRPVSRTTHRTLGKGHPPVSKAFPSSPGAGLAASVGPGATPHTPGGLRRSSRRSSLGPAEAGLPPTGIPAPAGSGVRTPGRPISVPVFGNGTPPPVPRIPSAHLRNGSRDKLGGLGVSTTTRERPRTMHEP